MLIFCLAARCKAINVFYSCDTRVVYSNPTWGTDLLLGFFFRPPVQGLLPADSLYKNFCPMAVKKIQIPGKQDLGHIGL
jgi:hypothetical protein